MEQPSRDKVTTIGEGGHRNWLYPASYTGKWLGRRRVFSTFLILFYFILPWTTINGHQTILLDIANRKFVLFGVVFWPQDTLLLWFVAISGALAIFLLTAQWGRVFCGWACPQTVFLDHVFRRIERWIEGEALTRRRRDKGPWTWEKIWRKALKMFVFFLVSSHFANTALCYFVGTDRVLEMTFQAPAQNWGWFTFMAFINGLFFFNFTWFREQFCIIACPYGRFQSVLLDSESTIVGYDYNRGEPRGVRRKNQNQDHLGDCIDCKRCVVVCPTGIDIRQGLQMECVNCTACIDACDEIMDKIGKPRQLIGYTSIASLEGRKRRFVRARTIAYALLLTLSTGVGAYQFSQRSDLVIRVMRPPGQSFTMAAGSQSITNQFQVKVSNKSDRPYALRPVVPEGYTAILAPSPFGVRPQSTAEAPLFVRRAAADFSRAGKERILVEFYDRDRLVGQSQITLLGPKTEDGSP